MRWLILLSLLGLVALGTMTFPLALRVNPVLALFLTGTASSHGPSLALAALALGAAGWCGRGGSTAIGAGSLLTGLAAAALLGRTAWCASRLGRELPSKLQAAFGPVPLPRAPFGVARLFAAGPPSPPPVTLTYARDLKLDFYRPAGAGPAPCVIAVHGGGWCSSNRGELAALNRRLAALGYAVAAIDYRLAPEAPRPERGRDDLRMLIGQRPTDASNAIWPAQAEDLLAAISFIRAHAGELGIDGDRLVIMGRSAGGQLAEAASYASRPPGVRGVVALYAPADLVGMWQPGAPDDFGLNLKRQFLYQFLGGTPQTNPKAYHDASGLAAAGPGSPPTLLIHGGLDTYVPLAQSEALADKLAANGVPHALIELPWATHILESNPSSPAGQLVLYSLQWFLGATVGPGNIALPSP